MRRQRNDEETNAVSSGPVAVNLRVGDIKCAQSSIRHKFSDGKDVGILIQELLNHTTHPRDLEIRVYRHEGHWFALDHRRAWAVITACPPNLRFRVLNDQNDEEFQRKFTTELGGLWPMWQFNYNAIADNNGGSNKDNRGSNKQKKTGNNNNNSTKGNLPEDVIEEKLLGIAQTIDTLEALVDE